jgi:hypothetical protein
MLLGKLYKLQNKNPMELFFSKNPIKYPILQIKQKMEVKNFLRK